LGHIIENLIGIISESILGDIAGGISGYITGYRAGIIVVTKNILAGLTGFLIPIYHVFYPVNPVGL
jgi:hypothetical protein